MHQTIHDNEADTSEPVVRALLRQECPRWAELPLEYLATSGTDNTMWRVEAPDSPDVVVRLPRQAEAAAGVLREMAVLRRVHECSLGPGIATPTVRHVGQPGAAFPHHWSVLEWLDGTDAWSQRNQLSAELLVTIGTDLAGAVQAIRGLDTTHVRERPAGARGGPLHPLLDRLEGWLTSPQWDAERMLDVAAVRRLAAQGREVADEPYERCVVHGDLIPGNLLVNKTGLSAIIDWGGAAVGDRAQDLAPAWAVLTAAQRPAFREAVEVDDATWIRGRTIELEHAVGGALYYLPKGHALGDVMARTLHRILTDT